ncbi:hypothetical protein JJ691_43720 [Kutzneria sp. CA-103260]|nr:hypothetical protein JJ691_43720 [Kutzneria sp. CA-103260]
MAYARPRIEAGAACPMIASIAIAQRLHAKSTRSHPKSSPEFSDWIAARSGGVGANLGIQANGS